MFACYKLKIAVCVDSKNILLLMPITKLYENSFKQKFITVSCDKTRVPKPVPAAPPHS